MTHTPHGTLAGPSATECWARDTLPPTDVIFLTACGICSKSGLVCQRLWRERWFFLQFPIIGHYVNWAEFSTPYNS